MIRGRKTIRAVICLVAAACLTASQASRAYEVPLTPASIHEAYVLGQRNDEHTADFLNPYLKQLKEEGAEGPHIAEIEIMTPFSQVVDQTRKNSSKGYTEQKATEDYKRRGDLVILRVLLMFPSAYPKAKENPAAPNTSPQAPSQPTNSSLRPENFWQNFRFSMKQQGKTIATKSMRNAPIYSSATKDAPSVLDGATVWLEYDAKDVASEETVVQVQTPDAKTISANFDLKKLR